jgi:isovaleryl-CoA dehydrogenase
VALIPNAWTGFDFGLGEDLDGLRRSVAAFARDRIAPRAAEIDRSNTFPRDLWPQMGELGLLGITVEEELGGAGMGYLAHCVAMEEVSRRSACPTAPIRTCASTRSGATAPRRRNRATCPS